MQRLSERKRELLVKIRFGFGINDHVHDLLDAYFNENNETCDDYDELQEALVEFIFKCDVFTQIKANTKYTRVFLKQIIDIVEKCGQEVNETLFRLYIEQINGPNHRDDTNRRDVGENSDKFHLVFFDRVIQ